MSLNQLIKDCQKGNSKAQENLYKLYGGVLFSVALKYSRNNEEAEDNLQDAFLTIFEKIVQYKAKGSFEGWLKRIVVNTALQRYRKQDVFEIVNVQDVEQADVIVDENAVPLDFLLKIVQDLPDRYRLVFNLYALDGYSHREVAAMLHINEGTSKSNLARARIILKEKIEAYQKAEVIQSSVQ